MEKVVRREQGEMQQQMATAQHVANVPLTHALHAADKTLAHAQGKDGTTGKSINLHSLEKYDDDQDQGRIETIPNDSVGWVYNDDGIYDGGDGRMIDIEVSEVDSLDDNNDNNNDEDDDEDNDDDDDDDDDESIVEEDEIKALQQHEVLIQRQELQLKEQRYLEHDTLSKEKHQVVTERQARRREIEKEKEKERKAKTFKIDVNKVT